MAFGSSDFTAGCGSPPEAGTFINLETMRREELFEVLAANTIVPWSFQVPPAAPGASHMIWTALPLASALFSLPSPKKPTCRLSGDQKG